MNKRLFAQVYAFSLAGFNALLTIHMLLFHYTLALLFFFFLPFNACRKPVSHSEEQPFSRIPARMPVAAGIIDEASGIADSHNNDGLLWVEQDSGNPADLYLIKHDGSFLKRVHMKGTVNRDWEDLVIAQGPGLGKYLYIGDIGDNHSVYHVYHIYRLPEPKSNADTIYSFDKLSFEYSDGPHDAEAFLVDDKNKDIFIITKRERASVVYKIPYPQSSTSINTASPVDTLPFAGAVSAAFSEDQNELIIKTYSRLYYWKRKQNESLQDLLKRSPVTIGYETEPQGEAVCFKKDNSGFYTLSEKATAASVSLKFYKRN